MTFRRRTTAFSERRKSSSLAGLLIGLVLCVGAAILLFWNEGEFVRTRDALREAEGDTMELASVTQRDPAYDGHVVHGTGYVSASGTLSDRLFDVSVAALGLRRQVQYFQWVEDSDTVTEERSGGGQITSTTYSYSTQWVSRPVNSNAFHDPDARLRNKNIVLLSVPTQSQYARNVRFGAYVLSDALVRKIPLDTDAKVTLPQAVVQKISSRLRKTKNMQGEYAAPGDLIHVIDENSLYLGADSELPEVGDVRIDFFMAPYGEMSLLAQCSNGTLVEYTAKNGKKVSALAYGRHSADELSSEQLQNASIETWLIRLLGLILECVGMRLLFAPLESLTNLVPVLGSLLTLGSALVSIVLGCAISCFVVAVAWLAYRPVVSAALLACTVFFILLLTIREKFFPAGQSR